MFWVIHVFSIRTVRDKISAAGKCHREILLS